MSTERSFLLGLAASLLPLAWADVEFTKPAAGDVISGTSLVASWAESGQKPAISTFSYYQLFLCVGGNNASEFVRQHCTVCLPLLTTKQIPVSDLLPYGTFSIGNIWSGAINPGWGANDTDAYFLKMISSSACGGTITNYSPRFTISSMQGSFPPNVIHGLQTIGTETSGPPTEQSPAALTCTSSVVAEPVATSTRAVTVSKSQPSTTSVPSKASASDSTSPSSNSNSNSITLSSGALAGIIVISILFVATIAGIALFVFLRIRKRRKHAQSPKPSFGLWSNRSKKLVRLDSTDQFAELSETAICKEMAADKRQPTELATAVRAELPTRTSIYEMPAS